MSDLKRGQEEFRETSAIKICEEESYRYFFFKKGFDAFRSSPEYLAMKEALEFYAIKDDFGTKAREVLKAIEEITK